MPLDFENIRGFTVRIFSNLCFLFCFFTYLRIIPIDAENQPICVVFALIALMFSGIPRNRITYLMLFFSGIIFCYFLFSIWLNLSRVGEVFLFGFGYFVPLVLYLAIWINAGVLSKNIYLFVIGLAFFVGAIQYHEFLEGLRPILSAIFEPIFSRFVATTFEDGRGVGMFFSEPAAASFFIIFFGLANVFFLLEKKITKLQAYVLTCMVLLMGYYNRSGTLFVLIFMLAIAAFLSALICGRKKIALSVISWLFALALLAAGFSDEEFIGEGRFFALLNVGSFFQVNDWQDLIQFSVLAGGSRLPSIVVGYGALLVNPLGFGVAGWVGHFSSVSDFLNIDLATLPLAEIERFADFIKPSAYGAAISFDFGFIGLIPLLMFIFSVIYKSIKSIPPERAFWPLVFALFGASTIFLYGITLLPVGWILLAFSCHLSSAQNSLLQNNKFHF